MDVTIQRHYAKFIYVVPDGLRELMSDITREVLRSQPSDLYTFIADYLDALMITRENARVASSLVVDIVQISETTAELLEKSGIKKSEANRAACVIQQKFKKMMEIKRHNKKTVPLDAKAIVDGILEEAHISREQAHNATIIVQKAYRSFMQREQIRRELLSDFIDWRVAARSAIALYRRTGVTYEEAHRASTLIKSAYKGYYQRKVMSRLVEEIKAGESVECLCDMYSIDVPAIEPARPASEECICSIESEDILEAELRDEGCLCEYTSSELIKIGRGEKIITDAGFEPIAPDEEDDEEGYCYCENNPDHPDRSVRLIDPDERSDNATIGRPVEFSLGNGYCDCILSVYNGTNFSPVRALASARSVYRNIRVVAHKFSASFSNAQLPPRYSIPGAVLVPQSRPPSSFRQGRLLPQEPQPQILQRPRRPNPTVRPVIEESIDQSSSFEDEINKLGVSALQSAVRQAEEEEQHLTARPFPTTIQFRPERPVPVLKQDIRDNYPSERPAPRPIARQQEYREQQPIRTPQRHPIQQSRPAARIPARPLENEEDNRRKKPVVQILRKYRTDNADGSITWGYENEDGTFKEETIGVDCIIRGKYGYVDPDGVKREYSYESGNPCDKPEEEEELPPQIPERRDQYKPQGKKIQYRPISQ